MTQTDDVPTTLADLPPLGPSAYAAAPAAGDVYGFYSNGLTDGRVVHVHDVTVTGKVLIQGGFVDEQPLPGLHEVGLADALAMLATGLWRPVPHVVFDPVVPPQPAANAAPARGVRNAADC